MSFGCYIFLPQLCELNFLSVIWMNFRMSIFDKGKLFKNEKNQERKISSIFDWYHSGHFYMEVINHRVYCKCLECELFCFFHEKKIIKPFSASELLKTEFVLAGNSWGRTWINSRLNECNRNAWPTFNCYSLHTKCAVYIDVYLPFVYRHFIFTFARYFMISSLKCSCILQQSH